jgi:hypothetical protein
MIAVTIWYRLNRDKAGNEVFEHNHIENGHCEGDKPTPKHPSHSAWARSKWRKEHAVLTSAGTIERDYDGWNPERTMS